MLIEFRVGNYNSFKDIVTFSMVAAKIKAKDETLDIKNTFEAKSLNLLKSAAIYGANASGKSNLIDAFAFMKDFVLNSTSRNSREQINVEPFLLNVSSAKAPSFFEVTFEINSVRYRYGFEVFQEKVHAEWLFRAVKRETALFWREDGQFDIKEGFKKARNLEEKTNDNALFLSVCDQWGIDIANSLIHWFTSVAIISGINDRGYLGFSIRAIHEEIDIKNRIIDYITKIDLGIIDIHSEGKRGLPKDLIEKLSQEVDIPDEIKDDLFDESRWFGGMVSMIRNTYDDDGNVVGEIDFNFDRQESEGTKKAFALSGPLFRQLEDGYVLFVDELDARLHPELTRRIIQLFNSEISNPNNAQLIFITHDTNLLSNKLFRRDQIWFAEKDRYGATDLYSLSDFNVRNDAQFESDYIAGKYGAIPYFGGFKQLTLGHNDG